MEQLAHHDMLTSSQARKAERQKASIDRWNQDVMEPNDSGLQAAGWSHDQKPPLAPHAYGSVDQAVNYQQLSHDPSGSFQADYNPGHQSSMSHRTQGAHSPAKRYNPYDLSPAYLGSYTDEPENPSSTYGGYPAADASHVPYGRHQSSGHYQPYSFQKQQGSHDRTSMRGGQHSYSVQEQSYYDQSRDQSYAPQHEQLTDQGSGFDFGTQQGWASQSRQQESQHARGNSSRQSRQEENQHARGNKSHRGGGRPAHSVGFGDLNQQQAAPYNAVSGREDDSRNTYEDPDSNLGEQLASATQAFDASQFKEPIQADIRPRGSKQKGRGRSSQQPYRPDKQPSLSRPQQVNLYTHRCIQAVCHSCPQLCSQSVNQLVSQC